MSRTRQDLEATAAYLDGGHLVVVGDVREPAASVRAVEAAVDAWGGLDVAILNAGISPSVCGMETLASDAWRDIVDVNLSGAFYGAQAAARVMEAGGRIIVTGSALGERPMEGLSAYSTTKAGVVGLVRALSVDLGSRGITVNGVAPGWFDSPLAERWMASERRTEKILGHTALHRWGAPEDLPGAFMFLASDAAAFITGVVLPVDGGYLVV
jgi:NAD(P)-dependent dehydrogenase (short-subunit alcohol dehydrogenase family)